MLMEKRSTKSKLPGYLEGFIAGKLATYIEPQRAGTPKGKLVGFSRAKYHASLLSLADLKGKDHARLAEVSHGTLRPWRQEREFIATVERHFEEWFRDFHLWVLAEAVVNQEIGNQLEKEPNQLFVPSHRPRGALKLHHDLAESFVKRMNAEIERDINVSKESRDSGDVKKLEVASHMAQ